MDSIPVRDSKFFWSYAHDILINSFTLKIVVKILTDPIQDTKG